MLVTFIIISSLLSTRTVSISVNNIVDHLIIKGHYSHIIYMYVQTPQWKGVLKAKECPKSCSMDGFLFRNGECDNDCNLLKCRWDGGDCDNTPAEGDGQQEAYYSTLDYANVLLNSLKNNGGRHYVAHTPHLYDTEIMYELQATFQVEFNLTSSHRKSSNLLNSKFLNLNCFSTC